MKKKFCIIQPGHIGDVIICLPIAKKLVDEGHEVYWPLFSQFFPHFTKGNVDYVKFLEIRSPDWYREIHESCKQKDIEPIDLVFNLPGCWHNNNTKLFGQTNMPFDEFKYKLANVDLNEKWKLSINRIKDREEELYNRVVKDEKYVLTHFQSSDVRKEVKLESLKDRKVIEIKPLTDCVFDWLTIIERADYLVFIDSVFVNMVEQLNLNHKKIYIEKRKGVKHNPVLRNEWKIINDV